MHIVVCIKAIPDPDIPITLFRVDENLKTVVSAVDLRYVMSPFDEQAIEGALRVREMFGEVRISLLCMGPESARAIVKKGLSLGADEAILLSDNAFEEADSYTTALTLATAIKKIGNVDLILGGRQAADTDAGVVCCGISELLCLPAVTFAKSLVVEENLARVERVLQNGVETIEILLPAVVSITHELGPPRSPSLRETMRSANKPITIWTAADLDLKPSQVGREGARRVLKNLYVPESKMVCELMEGNTPEETASSLIRRLREDKLI